MDSPQAPKSEVARIDSVFRLVVFLKGAQGILDLVASAVVFLIPLRAIVAFADHFTEGELAQDPDDFIATHLHDFAHNLSIGGKEYAAIYLVIHGIVKLLLAVGLLSGKRSAYPIGLAVIGALILYQTYRIWLHHSLLLTGATLFDCVLFYLIFREYLIARGKDGEIGVAV